MTKVLLATLCFLVLVGCMAPPKKAESNEGFPSNLSTIKTTTKLTRADLARRYAVLMSQNTITTLKHFDEIRSRGKGSVFTELQVHGERNNPQHYVTGLVAMLRSRVPNVFVVNSIVEATQSADFVIFIDFYCTWDGWKSDAKCDHILQIADVTLTRRFLVIQKHAYSSQPTFGDGPLRALSDAANDVLRISREEFEQAMKTILAGR